MGSLVEVIFGQEELAQLDPRLRVVYEDLKGPEWKRKACPDLQILVEFFDSVQSLIPGNEEGDFPLPKALKPANFNGKGGKRVYRIGWIVFDESVVDLTGQVVLFTGLVLHRLQFHDPVALGEATFQAADGVDGQLEAGNV